MRLKKFSGIKVHGYLDIKLKFSGNLNFLTGINGSGKTTALNAIVALITPDFHLLASLDYESLEVEVENNKHNHIIQSIRTEEGFCLSIKDASEKINIRQYVPDPDQPYYKVAEHEQEYYREIASSHASHPTLKLIASLPTPMFLGLDRRPRFDPGERRGRYAPPPNPMRFGRNVFGASLARSLEQAANLAATKYRDALIASGRVSDQLRRELLLSLLRAPSQQFGGFGGLAIPTASELNEIQRVRREMATLSSILQLPHRDVESNVLPFLTEMEESAKAIPRGAVVSDIIKSKPTDSRILQALLSWSANRSQLQRIKVISEIVEQYNALRTEALRPLDNYKKIVNDFLLESGKQISMSDQGYVRVALPTIATDKEISSLSSGEAQIFVILTHLAFSPDAQEANVFIIDEPELSLHIGWQEIFVENIIKANPNIQYILATHSPSIILNRVKECIDLTPKGVN